MNKQKLALLFTSFILIFSLSLLGYFELILDKNSEIQVNSVHATTPIT